MDIELLKTFQRVATLGSITKTADDLYLSVSTVTGRIKALEEQLGKELFLRAGRKIELSEEGAYFLSYINRFVSILNEGQKKIKLSKEGRTGELGLAVAPIIASYLMPKLVKDFKMNWPDVQLRLVACPNFQVIDKVNSGQVELGIISFSHQDNNLAAIKWFEDQWVLVAPNNVQVQKDLLYTPEDLKYYSFLVFSSYPFAWESVKKWFKTGNIKPNVIMELGHVETLKSLLVQFEALSFLPRISVMEEVEKGELQLIEIKKHILSHSEIDFVYRSSLPLSPTAQTFIDYAGSFVRDLYH